MSEKAKESKSTPTMALDYQTVKGRIRVPVDRPTAETPRTNEKETKSGKADNSN